MENDASINAGVRGNEDSQAVVAGACLSFRLHVQHLGAVGDGVTVSWVQVGLHHGLDKLLHVDDSGSREDSRARGILLYLASVLQINQARYYGYVDDTTPF